MKKVAAVLASLGFTLTSTFTSVIPANAASASPATITVSDCSVNSPTVSEQAILGAVNDTFTITNSGTGTCHVYPTMSRIDDNLGTPLLAPNAYGASWSIGAGASRTFKILGWGSGFGLRSNSEAGDLFTFYIAEPLSPAPTVTATGSVLAFTSGPSSWANNFEYPFACPNAALTSTGPSYLTQSALPGMGCLPLFSNNSGTRAFGSSFDLKNAFVGSGPNFVSYDPSTHGEHIVVQTAWEQIYYVTASTQVTPWASQVATPAPYNGPVLQAPGAIASVAQGSRLVIPGSNLSGVTKVEINGLDCAVSVNSDGELEITVPAGLAAGTYDLVVTSSSGKLTVQDGIRVSAESVPPLAGRDIRPSAKKNESAGEVKVRLFDVVGSGKAQIFVNGKEIAWINAVDASDSKLFDGYLVRTVTLVEGKTAIEVFVDGVRVQRWAYWR